MTKASLVSVLLGSLWLAGCAGEPATRDMGASPGPSVPALKPSRAPAADAGAACQLLDYTTVEQALGLSFEVAAGGQQDGTQTCVLQIAGASAPDLTLAVTSSNADPAVFRKTVVPKGAADLAGLGKAGYQLAVAAAPDAGRGPGVEIGWLSEAKRILVLRCTLPADAPQEEADALAGKLIELAKALDQPQA